MNHGPGKALGQGISDVVGRGDFANDNFFRLDLFPESNTRPGVSRNYGRLDQAAVELSQSMVIFRLGSA
jgi:hypothetical protein